MGGIELQVENLGVLMVKEGLMGKNIKVLYTITPLIKELISH
jgi:hypothetical protein